MNAKLAAISEKARTDFADLLREAEDKVLEAMHACSEEADDDSSPKFRIGFTVTLDLDADKMESALTFSIRRKFTAESQIPDPNQGELGIGATVTLKTADGKKTEPIPLGVFKSAVEDIKRQRREGK